jgi:hypothetical protein
MSGKSGELWLASIEEKPKRNMENAGRCHTKWLMCVSKIQQVKNTLLKGQLANFNFSKFLDWNKQLSECSGSRSLTCEIFYIILPRCVSQIMIVNC